MLKRIGAEEGGEFKAVASGTLPSGRPVIVNSDGTVSLPESITGANGTPNVFSNGTNATHNGMSEVGNSKFVIAYRDSGNSNYGTAVVATGSGTTLSYGTHAVFDSQDCREHVVVYDSSTDRVAIFYYGTGDDKAYAIVGTVSGTSISFGTRVEFEPNEMGDGSGVFDPVNNKVVLFYKDVGSNTNYGRYIIGTISGTSISLTTPTAWHSATTRQIAAVYDTTNSKMVVAYRDGAASSHGKMFVADPGASSLTFGSEQTFASATTYPHELVDDTVNGKLIIFYGNASQQGSARVITVDGANKTISAGSELVYEAGSTDTTGAAAYNTLAGKAQSMCKDQGDSNKGKLYLFTVSGTTITLDSTTVIDTNGTERFVGDFSPSLGASVFAYTDEDTSTGEAFVTKLGYNTLTSENYIGMSRGVVSYRSLTGGTGSETVFEAAAVKMVSATYDSNSEKVVIAYKDEGNSNQGTAIVGTVSGTSISFGTPAVFETGAVFDIAAAFDSSNNKVVIAYRDNSNSDYGTAVVGTVSGTGISFGTPVVFESAYAEKEDIVFDSSNSRIVIVYRDAGNSDKGTAIVGNVSGTSISFGTAVIFEDAIVRSPVAAFDSTNNKVVVAYEDSGNSDNGTAIVGTVDPSDNSISFGTAVVWETASTGSTQIAIAYDTTNSKVVISYPNAADSQHGYSIVGEVSGTSISFGTAVEFEGGSLNGAYINSIYNQAAEKIVVFYYDIGDSNKKKYVLGTVSGTSISFDTPVTVDASNTTPSHLGIAYISKFGDEGVIFGYEDDGNSSYGTSLVLQTGYTNKATRGEVANGGNASMDIIGSVSDNQIGLTAGQQYFVQNDGTISTTADSPSVLAGTAISATELVVKT